MLQDIVAGNFTQMTEKGVAFMAAMTNLSMTVLWLVILVVLVIIELLTMGLTTVWFAGGALVATIAALLKERL